MQENRIMKRIMRFHTEGSFSMIHVHRKTRLNMVIRESQLNEFCMVFIVLNKDHNSAANNNLNYIYGQKARVRN